MASNIGIGPDDEDLSIPMEQDDDTVHLSMENDGGDHPCDISPYLANSRISFQCKGDHKMLSD